MDYEAREAKELNVIITLVENNGYNKATTTNKERQPQQNET
jgi:hypothetical protein